MKPWIVLLTALGLATTGCSHAAAPVPQWAGTQTRLVAAGEQLAVDEAGWNALWAHIGQPVPQALTKDQQAVGLFAGQKRTGGYRIEIIQVTATAVQTLVQYRVVGPRLDDMVPQVITSPYAVLLLPRNTPPVLVEKVR
jgi:hypothetical protein